MHRRVGPLFLLLLNVFSFPRVGTVAAAVSEVLRMWNGESEEEVVRRMLMKTATVSFGC